MLSRSVALSVSLTLRYRHCSLIGAEPGSYYGAGIHFHNDSAWDYAWPDLQRPIGQPAGPAAVSADGLRFTRSFAHVTAVVDCVSQTGNITWH